MTSTRPAADPTVSGTPLAAQDEAGEVLRRLAHELRNPVAVLQGCAQTLVDLGENLSPETRRGLADVIVRHGRRLDWLLTAATALGQAPSGLVRRVDLAEVAAVTAAGCDVAMAQGPSVWVQGVEGRIRLAIQALMFALSVEGAEADLDSDGVLEVRAPVADLANAGRGWKLSLAEALTVTEGGWMSIEQADGRTRVRVRFGEENAGCLSS